MDTDQGTNNNKSVTLPKDVLQRKRQPDPKRSTERKQLQATQNTDFIVHVTSIALCKARKWENPIKNSIFHGNRKNCALRSATDAKHQIWGQAAEYRHNIASKPTT